MPRKPLLTAVSIIAILSLAFSPLPTFPQATPSAKQIIFLADDSSGEFVSVAISGRNQYGELTTWTKQDNRGFSLAYTKDWWWVQDFVDVSFTLRDNSGVETTDHCLIDALEQPASTPRVEIVYVAGVGCIGGEAGSTQDPILSTWLPIRDSVRNAFAWADYYLSDFNVDVFMHTLYTELNVIACLGGTALAFQTGGLSYAIAYPIITKACSTSGQEILKLFVKP